MPWSRPRASAGRAREFFTTYTRDLTAEDLHRLFTRDTREAYRFFARGVDPAALHGAPLHTRLLRRARLLFLAFSLKLSPARRAVFGAAFALGLLGLLQSFVGFHARRIPLIPFVLSLPLPIADWRPGAMALFTAFVLLNLLVLLEVAERLLLKNDLEVARDIQQAMLPRGTHRGHGVHAFGLTRPANTVGGDFYDVLPLADGRLAVALGDVAGKGSPAALLMALLLAILRTLIDENLDAAALMARLNAQVARHAPGTRFITLFLAFYDPATGSIEYVNAGHLPPIVRRRSGEFERLSEGGVALGMFDGSTYRSGVTQLLPGDLLVLYSDGITEAENPAGHPFEESGLEAAIAGSADLELERIGRDVFEAVAHHARDQRFGDDLTLLILRRDVEVADPVNTFQLARV